MRKRPPALTILGYASIIYGTLAAMTQLYMITVLGDIFRGPDLFERARMTIYGVQAFLGVPLLALGGVGLLLLKAWGRKLIIWYAWVCLAIHALFMLLSVAEIVGRPSFGMGGINGINFQFYRLAAMSLGLVFPLVLLAFMLLPETKQALRHPSEPGPEWGSEAGEMARPEQPPLR